MLTTPVCQLVALVTYAIGQATTSAALDARQITAAFQNCTLRRPAMPQTCLHGFGPHTCASKVHSTRPADTPSPKTASSVLS